MPYQGRLVSLTEMLDILTSHGRSEAAAVLELERALEDKAIELRLRDGSDPDGEPLYRPLSAAEMSAIISVLRIFPNRMRLPAIRSWNIPIETVEAAYAIRLLFEAACGLVGHSAGTALSQTPQTAGFRTTKHVDAETACGEFIRALPKEPRQRREDVQKQAMGKFEGLSQNAFRRQWDLNIHPEWKAQGRLPGTLQ